MGSMSQIIEQRAVLRSLVLKNLKTKYAGSALGMLWAFINPLLLALVVGFVFSDIFKMSDKNFYLFIIAGMVPWTFFAGSLQESSLSITSNAAILKQFSMPKVFIPASVVLANFIILVFSLAVVTPFFLAVNPHLAMMLPLLALVLTAFLLLTLGLCLALAAACVEWRDINQVLNTVLMFWLWLTPVFYSVDMVPREYQPIARFNPVTLYMDLFRTALYEPAQGYGASACLALVLSCGVCAAGLAVFLKREGRFLHRL